MRKFLSGSWRLSLLLLLVCLGCHDQEATTTQAQPASAAGNSTQSNAEVNTRIETILRAAMSVPDDVEIDFGERAASPQFPGYDHILITFVSAHGAHKAPVDFVISKDNQTLFQIHPYELKADVLKQTMNQIDLKDRPFRGGSNAKVVIVNYDDFECPFCARTHMTFFPGLLNHYGDKIKIVYKDFPLVEIHPWAMRAATDANCLAQQSSDAFWGFADNVHGHQPEIVGTQEKPRALQDQTEDVDKIAVTQAQQYRLNLKSLQACMAAADRSPIEAEMQEGRNLGVQSTPTMFINGIKVSTSMSESGLRQIIDMALQDAGVTPPAAKQ